MGHPARECPNGKGAVGKGKGSFKGNDKGAWGKEFGKLAETMFMEIMSETNRQRRNQANEKK